ncbi:hypothetical protein XM38_015520 [Halomicronema hongdechloris C2206]|uniref:Uncharacterized protein n=1 Tax=Halomicronema hongdechloris C2206 TaxID=1641165 RepID=A0A1Z3HJW6_9CYAN|nr:hypothetical protein [Halomicronema hongdechloris]ASC70612.1 hypothetical protein XM38_015520 [Halomicronema hongdechloris C2206]
MPDFAYNRLVRGELMAGMFVVNDRMPIRQAIDDLILLVDCSEQAEWQDVVLGTSKNSQSDLSMRS